MDKLNIGRTQLKKNIYIYYINEVAVNANEIKF